MKKSKKDIGKTMWISGNFSLYKTDNVLKYIPDKNPTIGYVKYIKVNAAHFLEDIYLEKQRVTIIDRDKFMLANGDIFLI